MTIPAEGLVTMKDNIPPDLADDPSYQPPSGQSPSSDRLLMLMPFVFVLLWSTGFIVAKLGMPYAPPITFTFLRFTSVALVLLPLVLIMRAPWPTGRVCDIALSGILLHAGYIGSVWSAIKFGMPTGVAALIAGMQPVLTAFGAPLIGEKVGRRQWIGLLFGLCGVGLVVSNKITAIGLSYGSLGLAVFGLVSITVGTLYQKHRCAHFDLRSGTLIQYIASAIVMLPLAIYFEGADTTLRTVHVTPPFVAAMLWAIFALSIGAIFLLFALIRRSAATSVTSLLYLTPPTTALMAWALFGESFSLTGLAGMVLAVAGVAFVMKK
jgi:drug/metabolite transporter (DMT)-like permease